MPASGAAGDGVAETGRETSNSAEQDTGAPTDAHSDEFPGGLQSDAAPVADKPLVRATKTRAVDRGPAAKGRLTDSEVADLDLGHLRGCRHLVCAGFCTFFKAQPEIDDHCGGLSEVERLVRRVCVDPAGATRLREALIRLVGSEEPVSYRWDEELARLICGACPFLPDGGCDHRNPELDQQQRLEPCGGYILLAALADAAGDRVGRGAIAASRLASDAPDHPTRLTPSARRGSARPALSGHP